MSRWLITGAAGMLGADLQAALAARGEVQVTATDHAGLDITDPDAVAAAVADHDVIVNCAAWTRVDDAESHEGAAFAVNAVGPATLARAAAATGARLVHLSTDYVFAGHPEPTPGQAPAPYPEDAPIAPATAYGRTKAAGEWAVRACLPDRHIILRTAWLYGAHGPNFVATMARLAATHQNVDVVADQHGQPTASSDLAGRIIDVIDTDIPAGTYHATNTGQTTWYHLARTVFELIGADPDRIRPVTSAAYARPAPRPAWSVLGQQHWSHTPLPPLRHWHDALTDTIRTVLHTLSG